MRLFVRASAERHIEAPAEIVYGILADYVDKHPSILPTPPFGDYEVLKGGYGAGTEIRFTMSAFGRVNAAHGVVTEPTPGRVLREDYGEKELRTTFTVDPASDGSCRARFDTQWRSFFLLAWMERLLAPRFLRKVYEEELDNLERLALALSEGAERDAT